MSPQRLEKQAFEANRKAVLDALSPTGYGYLEVTFEGSNDSGQIYAPDLPNGMALSSNTELAKTVVIRTDVGHDDGEPILLQKPVPLSDALTDLAADALESTHGGWEINGGSEGRVVFVLDPNGVGDANLSQDGNDLTAGALVIEYNPFDDDSESEVVDVTAELPDGLVNALRAAFADTDVTGLQVEYEGSGDSGDIAGVFLQKKLKNAVTEDTHVVSEDMPKDVGRDQVSVPSRKAGVSLPLDDALIDLADHFLNKHFDGCFNNEGASGNLLIDLEDGTAQIHHTAYVTEQLDTEIDFV